MRRLPWLGQILIAGLASTSLAADIQVICDPALRVFLDGKLAGVSSAKDDGLFLADVPEGSHVIRVEKDGFLAQTFDLVVGELPLEVLVGEFVPRPEARNEREVAAIRAEPSGGTLVVTSAPQNCTIEIDGRLEQKKVPVLRLEGLASGSHTIAFSKAGYERIAGTVQVLAGADVTVRGDLKAGQVQTVQGGKGSLRVISMPENCTVRFLGKIHDKTLPRLNISYVPAGEHPIGVEWAGRRLTTTVMIRKGLRTVLNVSFVKGQEPFVITYEPE